MAKNCFLLIYYNSLYLSGAIRDYVWFGTYSWCFVIRCSGKSCMKNYSDIRNDIDDPFLSCVETNENYYSWNSHSRRITNEIISLANTLVVLVFLYFYLSNNLWNNLTKFKQINSINYVNVKQKVLTFINKNIYTWVQNMFYVIP